MGDCDSVIPELEREENIVAAAKQIMMALRSKMSLKDDTKKILANLSSQLIALTTVNETDVDVISEIERHLTVIQEKIMSCETDQSMIWDSGLDKATEYLNAVDGVRKLTERLEASCLDKDDWQKELLRRAQDALQMAMARLGEEFEHMLVQNRQPYDLMLDCMSACSAHAGSVISLEDDLDGVSVCSAHAGSVISLEDDLNGVSLHRDSVSRKSGEFIIDLVDPDVISHLRCIANLMFISGYGHECSQAYVRIGRDALDECLSILEIEKISIEDVMKLGWSSLNSKIEIWIHTMKIFVRVYLASEKRLTRQIFGELEKSDLVCFAEVSKASMLQLLSFGEAISIGPLYLEMLFRILDMYEVLTDLLPDVDSLYSFETGSQVRIDCREVLRRLGNSVRATFLEFENAIAASTTSISYVRGGIDHLNKYVMNYITALAGYHKTLNLLLKGEDGEDPISVSINMSSDMEEENISGGTCDFSPVVPQFRSSASILEWLFNGSPTNSAAEENNVSGGICKFSPMSLHFQSVASILEWLSSGFPIYGGSCDLSPVALLFRAIVEILECKLNDKAKLVKDASLQQIFLMNNIHYMAQKVNRSELRCIFGDEWFRKLNGKFQQHATNYERATWSSLLSLLKVEGHPQSNSVSRTLVLRRFNHAFEQVYRTQTAWSIPDAELREDLRIMASIKVIQAYRTFLGRSYNLISIKRIKYSADDLQDYLMDLFEGAPRSLQRRYRSIGGSMTNPTSQNV